MSLQSECEESFNPNGVSLLLPPLAQGRLHDCHSDIYPRRQAARGPRCSRRIFQPLTHKSCRGGSLRPPVKLCKQSNHNKNKRHRNKAYQQVIECGFS